jgi:hypothetical protein
VRAFAGLTDAAEDAATRCSRPSPPRAGAGAQPRVGDGPPAPGPGRRAHAAAHAARHAREVVRELGAARQAAAAWPCRTPRCWPSRARATTSCSRTRRATSSTRA